MELRLKQLSQAVIRECVTCEDLRCQQVGPWHFAIFRFSSLDQRQPLLPESESALIRHRGDK